MKSATLRVRTRPATPEALALLEEARRHPTKHRWQQRLRRMRSRTRPLWGRPPVGMVFAQYLILTGLARFLVEFIRINPRHFFGLNPAWFPGLSNAQAASLASIALGAALLWHLRRSPADSPARVK